MAITGHRTHKVFERYDTVDRDAEEKALREIICGSSGIKMVSVKENEGKSNL